jgi:hypothetical protein
MEMIMVTRMVTIREIQMETKMDSISETITGTKMGRILDKIMLTLMAEIKILVKSTKTEQMIINMDRKMEEIMVHQ